MGCDPVTEFIHVPRLDVNLARASEPADNTFTSRHAVDSAFASFFDGILTTPCHKMSVVDNVLFVLLKLFDESVGVQVE